MERTVTGCLLHAAFLFGIPTIVSLVKISANFTAIDWLHIILIIILIIAIILVVKFFRDSKNEFSKKISIARKYDEEKKLRADIEKEKSSLQFLYDLTIKKQTEAKEKWINDQQEIFNKEKQELARAYRHKENCLKRKEELLEETLQGALRERSISQYYDYKEREEWEDQQEFLLIEREEWLEERMKGSQFRRSAALYADFKVLEFDAIEAFLKTKRNPVKLGSTTDQELNRLKNITREHTALYKEMKYKWEYLMNIFPELEDYVDDDELISTAPDYENLEDLHNDYDRAKLYVSKEEYEGMSVNARNQLALDRWWKQPCGVEEAGKRYELYCGYFFEKKGYKVEYHGIKEGKNDLGIDLIATKDSKTLIIQCKRRRQEGKIHHNTVCQLFGSTVWYADRKKLKLFEDVTPVLMTSGELDETAEKMAKVLSIEVCHKPMGIYPIIKCNINNGNKIYHLPFDQQYNNTIIEPEKGEFYALTVEEATKAEFRRAFKHYTN